MIRRHGRGAPRLAARAGTAVVALAVGALVLARPARAQEEGRRGEASGAQNMYLRGMTVSPAYEGWWRNEDGTFELFFGYMNSNWEQEFDVPVGPQNYFAFTRAGGLDDYSIDAYDPATADQGQPTHFYPRRNPFLFTIRLPNNFPRDQELVWTLVTNRTKRRVYASLSPEYAIDKQVISTETGGAGGSLADRLRDNVAPELRLEGEKTRTIRVGQPLTLVAVANDPDNYPPPGSGGGGGAAAGQRPDPEQIYANPPGAGVVGTVAGLRFSWMVYRGPADHVSFSPTPTKTWMDTRPYANSPWSRPRGPIPPVPPDGRWVFEVTFDEPGEFVLRAVASDSALHTYDNVKVTVTP